MTNKSNHSIEVGQVYTVKPEFKREWRSDTLTITHVNNNDESFMAKEVADEYVFQLLLDCYNIVKK